jgi:hypothetical protein
MSARTHARSTTLVEEDRQHTPQDGDDIPSSSPHTPAPAEPPDEAANRQNDPPSVELEGERMLYPSCDVGPTSGNAHASGATQGDEDPRNRPKGAPDTLEQSRQRSKSQEEENSPSRAPDDPDEPGGETAATPGDLHSTQEGPRAGTSDDVDGTDASCRDRTPGGHLDLENKSGDVEGDSDRDKVVNSGGHDGSKRTRKVEIEGQEARRPLRRVGRVGRHRGRSGAPKQWRWRPDRWETTWDGRRNERRAPWLETSRTGTAS